MVIDEDAVFAEACALGLRLQDLGWTVATVESCTGGMIARALTETAGSSAWFDRGFVTYSNAAKVELVGVTEDCLREHGAVSESTAREMAQGGLARSGARLALSVTGIAGPGGATPGKPVGTVCFGWAWTDPEGGVSTRVETCRFDGDRAAVRRAAAFHALQHARSILPLSPKD